MKDLGNIPLVFQKEEEDLEVEDGIDDGDQELPDFDAPDQTGKQIKKFISQIFFR